MTAGRPTKYKPEYAEQAEKLCAMKGFTDVELAEFFGVSESTIYEWKNKNPKFSEALKSKQYSDDKVAQSLYERCFNSEYVETKEENGSQGSKITTTTKQVLGDISAMRYWLNNRNPDRWRAQPEKEVKTEDSLVESIGKLIDKLPN